MKKIGLLLTVMICTVFLSTKEVKAAPEVVISKSLQQLVYWDNETQQVFLACPVSTGIDPNDTPCGIFSTSDVYPTWHALFYNQWAYGAIRVHDHILLHSVPYLAPDATTLDLNEQMKLGTPASHGCIRMSTENIQFLVQTLPRGSRVLVIK
ncbi:MAG: L,D-transpeptidase [Lachnospiraceae bacterium]|nr:L,D-transpeptidase [Lachnospiraceae bacterium]